MISHNRYPFWASALFVSAVVFLLYSVSLGHNFLYDEEGIILSNPALRSLSRIPEMLQNGYFYHPDESQLRWNLYYRPLTSLTFMIDFQFWKFDPLGYNLTNLFLHLVLCVLFFKLLDIFLGHRLAAFLAALLYAVHTIHTEAVTYIASRGDLLGMVLMLMTFLLYIRGRVFCSLLCYFLAFFSKETMLLVPFYIVLLDLTYVKNTGRQFFSRVAPFFVLMAGLILYRKFLCPVPMVPLGLDERTTLLRVLGMGDGILQYLRALIAPEYFKSYSDVPVLYGFSDPLIWSAICVGASLAAAWLLAWRYRGLAFFGMSVFLIGLVPHFQVIPVYPKWAEHYICIPALGLFLLLGLFFRRILENKKKPVLAVFMLVYFFFFVFWSVRTYQRNAVYNDVHQYYTELSRTDTPYRFFGHQQLARRALGKRDLKTALPHIQSALAQEYKSTYTHELYGYYHLFAGEPKKAAREFGLSARYLQNSAWPLRLQGRAWIEAREYDKALKAFIAAYRLAPDRFDSYIDLIRIYEILNLHDQAWRWSDAALRCFRNDSSYSALILFTRARMRYRQGYFSEARAELERVLSEYPGVALNADVSRFCLGKISVDEFYSLIRRRYQFLHKDAPAYVVMSFVLRGDREGLRGYMKQAHEKLAACASHDLLIKREIKNAQEYLRHGAATGPAGKPETEAS